MIFGVGVRTPAIADVDADDGDLNADVIVVGDELIDDALVFTIIIEGKHAAQPVEDQLVSVFGVELDDILDISATSELFGEGTRKNKTPWSHQGFQTRLDKILRYYYCKFIFL